MTDMLDSLFLLNLYMSHTLNDIFYNVHCRNIQLELKQIKFFFYKMREREHTFITIITAFNNTSWFFIFYPIFFACQTKSITCTCFTSCWAWHTFLTFFITIITIRTTIQAFSIVRKTSGTTCYTLSFRWPIACWTGRMTFSTTKKIMIEEKENLNKNEK